METYTLLFLNTTRSISLLSSEQPYIHTAHWEAAFMNEIPHSSYKTTNTWNTSSPWNKKQSTNFPFLAEYPIRNPAYCLQANTFFLQRKEKQPRHSIIVRPLAEKGDMGSDVGSSLWQSDCCFFCWATHTNRKKILSRKEYHILLFVKKQLPGLNIKRKLKPINIT